MKVWVKISTFSHPIAIAATAEGPFEDVEAVVDAGAFYTWVPSPILERLGVQRAGRRQFGLATGAPIERDIGLIVIRINSEIWPTICTFGDEGSSILLGAVTLEQFALAADPVNKHLVPMPRLSMLRISGQP